MEINYSVMFDSWKKALLDKRWDIIARMIYDFNCAKLINDKNEFIELVPKPVFITESERSEL